jgi:hypothetical protein
MWVLIFSTNLSEIFLIPSRIQWDIINVLISLCKEPFILDFTENCIFSVDFLKNSNIQFRENPSIRNRVLPCGRTGGLEDGHADRHDKANSRFSQFCKWTWKRYALSTLKLEAKDSSDKLKNTFNKKWEPKILRQCTTEHLIHKLQYSSLFHVT